MAVEIKFGKKINFGGKIISLHDWQAEALAKLDNKDGVLSAPTGSGKTLVANIWAGLLDTIAQLDEYKGEPIIYTAPLKALVNEKHAELLDAIYSAYLEKGLDSDKALEKSRQLVGVHTGDRKEINKKNKILVCTQEIYLSIYKRALPRAKVVVDEIHYIFNNKGRARNYLDSIRKAPRGHKYLFMSGTLGAEAGDFVKYLEKISGKKLVFYSTSYRPTKQVYMENELDYIDGNTYIVNFSVANSRTLAKKLVSLKEKFIDPSLWTSLEEKLEVKKLAKKFGVELGDYPEFLEGVAAYYGGLPIKVKLLVEELAKRELIKIVVGTDAIGIGVNLPFKYVAYNSMSKLDEGVVRPLDIFEFLQINGRAGRLGYYNTGYIACVSSEIFVGPPPAFATRGKIWEDLVSKVKSGVIHTPHLILDINFENLFKRFSKMPLITREDIKEGGKIYNLVIEEIVEIIETAFINEKILDNKESKDKIIEEQVIKKAEEFLNNLDSFLKLYEDKASRLLTITGDIYDYRVSPEALLATLEYVAKVLEDLEKLDISSKTKILKLDAFAIERTLYILSNKLDDLYRKKRDSRLTLASAILSKNLHGVKILGYTVQVLNYRKLGEIARKLLAF